MSLDKDEDDMGEKFIGQDALKKVKENGLAKTLIGLKIDGKRTPRQGMTVKNGAGDLGIVTSGCTSPTMGCPIAMAYVKPGSVNVGEKVAIDLGSTEVEAEVVNLPFYKAEKK